MKYSLEKCEHINGRAWQHGECAHCLVEYIQRLEHELAMRVLEKSATECKSTGEK